MQGMTINANHRGFSKQCGHLDSLPCALVEMDNFFIVRVINRRAEEFTGNRSQFIGKPVDTLGQVFPFLPQLMRQAMQKRARLRHVEDTPPDCWLVSTRTHRKRRGEIDGVFASIENISFYHDWYRERHRQEKLDLLGRLTEQTAHEIRNPLTTIKGFLQMYQLYPDSIPWEVIWQEIEAIEKCLDGLLALSPNFTAPLETLDLNHTVCEVCSSLEDQAVEQGVWMVLSLPTNLGKITGTQEKIATLIRHLCLNALDAMPSGGILAVTTERKRKQIILTVTDTGTGISRELVDKVFEPFLTTHPDKAGLGLPICKQIVKVCGGTINVKSREGAGTVVTVSLPQA